VICLLTIDLLESHVREDPLSRNRLIESHLLGDLSSKSRGLKIRLLKSCPTVDCQAAVVVGCPAMGRLTVTSIWTSWSSTSSSVHLLHRPSSSSQPVPPDAALPAVRCMPSPKRRTGASSMAT
jgi:hypothetical protein